MLIRAIYHFIHNKILLKMIMYICKLTIIQYTILPYNKKKKLFLRMTALDIINAKQNIQ